MSKLREIIRKVIKEETSKKNRLMEATVEKRGEYEGIKYLIVHQPPDGYRVMGNDVESKDVFKGDREWFDRIGDAIDHAERSIDGYLLDDEE